MIDPSNFNGVVLELFSGIGGMRAGLERVADTGAITLRDVTAVDINHFANSMYSHNFHSPDGKVKGRVVTKLIEQFSPEWLDKLGADLWTMSPPCQPFTTTWGAKQRDVDDPRCAALVHIGLVLSKMHSPPKWIFLENVKGFLDSRAHHGFREALKAAGYTFREFLIDPQKSGLSPNHRTRLYMIAERSDRFLGDDVTRDLGPICSLTEDGSAKVPPPLSSIMLTDEELGEEQLEELYLPEKVLAAPWVKTGLSVVGPHDSRTWCFTTNYGKALNKSAGSCFLPDAKQELAVHPLDRSDMTTYLGRVRCFSPRELLLLFGFPTSFVFPPGMQRKHRFKLIGNSVNVHVITAMLSVVFSAPGHATSSKHRFDRKEEERRRKAGAPSNNGGQWNWLAAFGLFLGLNMALRRM